ncbi:MULTISPECIES: Gfo/Idh/MocA family protein [Thermoactinomyces]|uniref:Gfo/Idh/MocA family oxidoreductase n=1 Tax=Thermoactinomyces vulgaris TaxID=2026 RepID=A0ABS0QFV5_THEVU|nr:MULTISPECIES: Gfo/Idh/MocA family oxidoreductase [Thermoactinomyces]KYQ86213.1 oxidoreductase [Thermoactinomyces sp. AS95]MBA4551029.1 Gfo/Idh/MocA family oxidoreductase [Thermoactinomyces vulgaris]MBA4597012.1 Gfo/Idh/MocA family oxidoreductase [Thermoactinomyces vulgaris]MBH8588154.1 Gfo/Idh/MocA family oxidoreductase [Thermoactinomyces vulgaris]MBI0387231.1 Gfo/Idh/MocA family oxidoreductase [Thermoactinomyces sp. CICC 24227]
MIRYGIVGCGHIAKKHVAAIKAVEGAELVAVCDTNEERLSEFAVDGVRGYTDLKDMLASDVDVVCICTPSGIHAPLTIQAAEAKKHVIVEKPMALTLEDADRMIDACEKNGVKMAVVHPNRFRPAVVELRKQLEQGAFGKIGHANATVRWNRNQAYYDQAPWRGTKAMDGGVLMNQAIHNMDLLLWMMGDIEEISSYHATRIRNIEAEDTSVSVIRFKNGALGVLEAAVTIYPKNLEESLSIFGEKGTAVIGGPTANWIKEWKFEGLPDEEAQNTIRRVEQDPFGIPGHQCIIQDMTEAVLKDRKPVVSGEEGRKALSFVIGCQLAAERNRPVRMDELNRK